MSVVKRSFFVSNEAAIATETAFLMPVLLIGIMMFLELARVVLIISIGSTAMNASIQSLREEDTLDEQTVQRLVLERIVDDQYSYGYLSVNDVQVSVEKFDSLEKMGVAYGEASSEKKDDDTSTVKELPVWNITVDIKKDYLTPLPRLLTLDDTFRYRFRQVIGHLYDDSTTSTQANEGAS